MRVNNDENTYNEFDTYNTPVVVVVVLEHDICGDVHTCAYNAM